MRLSPDEPAATVLDRLRSAEPRRPTYVDPHNKQPHQDRTFEERHAAWRAAVEREEARLQAEKDGKLEEHIRELGARQDKLRAVRLKMEAAAKRAQAAARKTAKKIKTRRR